MWLLTHDCSQGYAFASGVRHCMGKDQLMNMNNYDKSIFVLHRKLFHRYMKYVKFFRKATVELPVYQKAIALEAKVKVKVEKNLSPLLHLKNIPPSLTCVVHLRTRSVPRLWTRVMTRVVPIVTIWTGLTLKLPDRCASTSEAPQFNTGGSKKFFT